jgi:hypothetical protein
MGAAEEVGRVAGAAIEGLKASPSCLVAMLFGIAMALLSFWYLQQEEDRDAAATLRQLDMLSSCYERKKQGDL